MASNTTKQQLTNHATIVVQRDQYGELQSFDIVNPAVGSEPASQLHVDLTQNKQLWSREQVLKAATLLAENVPAFTALSDSIAKSGFTQFSSQNPDSSRFGIAELPGITNNEINHGSKPVVIEGSLTQPYTAGYEQYPRTYTDNAGKTQDLQPAIALMYQLAYASEDLQQWPLPKLPNAGPGGVAHLAHNTSQVSNFVQDAIPFESDASPTLDKLKAVGVPKILQDKGYPEPKLVDEPKAEIDAQDIFDRRLAENIAKHQLAMAELAANSLSL